MEELEIQQESTKGDYSLEDAKEQYDFIVLLFQRDFFCTNCRNQVQDIEDRYEEFTDRETQVISVLPERLGRAEKWDEKYELSYPVIADEDKKISDSFNQPVRFGALGNLHDLLGRMPLTVILDCRGDEVKQVYPSKEECLRS